MAALEKTRNEKGKLVSKVMTIFQPVLWERKARESQGSPQQRQQDLV